MTVGYRDELRKGKTPRNYRRNLRKTKNNNDNKKPTKENAQTLQDTEMILLPNLSFKHTYICIKTKSIYVFQLPSGIS